MRRLTLVLLVAAGCARTGRPGTLDAARAPVEGPVGGPVGGPGLASVAPPVGPAPSPRPPAASDPARAPTAAPAPLSALEVVDALEALDPELLVAPVVTSVLRRIAGGDDCEAAARAALLLAARGDDQYLPSRALLRSEREATRALCVARHVAPSEALAVLGALVTTDGLELALVDHGYWPDEAVDPDRDGDADPATRTTRTHVLRSGLATSEVVEWLPTHCLDGWCHGPWGSVVLGFARIPGAGLALEEVSIERVPDGSER